jgi:hypothetical protein
MLCNSLPISNSEELQTFHEQKLFISTPILFIYREIESVLILTAPSYNNSVIVSALMVAQFNASTKARNAKVKVSANCAANNDQMSYIFVTIITMVFLAKILHGA